MGLMNVANFSLPDDRTDRWRVKLRGDAVCPEGALFIPISYSICMGDVVKF